jgi:hypothetical protein
MDVPLYALALIVFAVLYLALAVYLAFAIVIALIVMFTYLALRYGDLGKNYPYGLTDSLVTATFIGVTWGIFTYLAQKNPIPFIGSGLTYSSSTNVPFSAIVTITLVLSVCFLILGSFVAQSRARLGTGGGVGAVPAQGNSGEK